MTLQLNVDAAPILPPRVGLLAAALSPEITDPHWEQGITWTEEPWLDANAGIFDPGICANPTASLVADTVPAGNSMTPLAIFAEFTCTTMTKSPDLNERARRALGAHASRQIARELWTGVGATAAGYDNDWFVKSGLATVITTVQSPIRAMSELEGWAAENVAGLSFIHASRRLISYWQSAQLLRRDGNLIRTVNDNIVVPDEGYPVAGPAGQTAGSAGVPWAFVSRPVAVKLGNVVVYGPETFSDSIRSTNDRTYQATASFAYQFDVQGLGAIRVTACSTTDC